MNADTAIDKWLTWVDGLLDSALKTLPVTLFIALSPGVCIGILLYQNVAPDFQMTNSIPQHLLPGMLQVTTGVTIALLSVILAIYLAVSIARKRSKQIPILNTVATLNQFGAIVLAFPLFLTLGIRSLPGEHPFVSIIISLACASIAGIYVYRFPGISHRLPAWVNRYRSPIAIALLCIGMILRIRFQEGTMIGLQSLWLAAGAIPVFLISRLHVKNNWIALAISIGYLLYPGIHGMVIDDIHSLPVAGPVILWSLYFVEIRKFIFYFLLLAVLLFIREDLSLAMLFVGFYLISRKPDLRVGLASIVGCILYFAASRLFIQPAGGTVEFDTLFEAFQVRNYTPEQSVVITALTNPMYMIQQGMREYKMVCLLLLLSPLLMLPLLAGRRLVTCGYGLLFGLLISRRDLCSIESEYTTFLYPFFFAMVPAVLPRIGAYRCVSWFRPDSKRLVTALTVALLASAICISYCYGGVPKNEPTPSEDAAAVSMRAGTHSPRLLPTEICRQTAAGMDKHFPSLFYEI